MAVKKRKTSSLLNPGANPTNSEFTTTTAGIVVEKSLFKVEEYIFVFKMH
jgi:hypothetical protein